MSAILSSSMLGKAFKVLRLISLVPRRSAFTAVESRIYTLSLPIFLTYFSNRGGEGATPFTRFKCFDDWCRPKDLETAIAAFTTLLSASRDRVELERRARDFMASLYPSPTEVVPGADLLAAAVLDIATLFGSHRDAYEGFDPYLWSWVIEPIRDAAAQVLDVLTVRHCEYLRRVIGSGGDVSRIADRLGPVPVLTVARRALSDKSLNAGDVGVALLRHETRKIVQSLPVTSRHGARFTLADFSKLSDHAPRLRALLDFMDGSPPRFLYSAEFRGRDALRVATEIFVPQHTAADGPEKVQSRGDDGVRCRPLERPRPWSLCHFCKVPLEQDVLEFVARGEIYVVHSECLTGQSGDSRPTPSLCRTLVPDRYALDADFFSHYDGSDGYLVLFEMARLVDRALLATPYLAPDDPGEDLSGYMFPLYQFVPRRDDVDPSPHCLERAAVTGRPLGEVVEGYRVAVGEVIDRVDSLH